MSGSMISGGVQVKQRTRETVRFAGILLPIALVLYGILVDLIPINGRQPDYVFSAVMIPWVLFSLAMFLFRSKNQLTVFIRLAAYHVFAGAYVILISGFLTPFVALAWVLLMLVSYIYLSNKGLLLNLIILVAASISNTLMHMDSREAVIANITSVASIIIIGTVIIAISRIQQADSEELARTKAQESLQSNRIHTLINNLADAVINIDAEGRVEIYNAASLSLLNTNVSLHQQLIDEVIVLRNQSGKRVKLLDMAQKTRGVRKRDDLSLEIDEEVIRLEVTTSPIRSTYSRSRGESSTDGYVLIMRDITKSKSLEEERDEFISVVSHELRTPITVVEGTLSNVQVMLEKGKTPPGTLERSLADAHEQIMFLSRMVNDLSTLSRAERGMADDVEQIDVKTMATSLFKEYAPQAEKKKLHFNLDATGQLGTVTTSHLYLRELLQNLITNAIKYTKEGSVTLQVSRSGKSVVFAVRDTGIGISKGDQLRIFDKFYRSEDYRTRETGGTGLGLYVASKLSRKLGTNIEIKSRLNHGSTFSFSMPVDTKSKA